MARFAANSYDFETNNNNRKTKINTPNNIIININEKTTDYNCYDEEYTVEYGNDWFYAF